MPGWRARTAHPGRTQHEGCRALDALRERFHKERSPGDAANEVERAWPNSTSQAGPAVRGTHTKPATNRHVSNTRDAERQLALPSRLKAIATNVIGAVARAVRVASRTPRHSTVVVVKPRQWTRPARFSAGGAPSADDAVRDAVRRERWGGLRGGRRGTGSPSAKAEPA